MALVLLVATLPALAAFAAAIRLDSPGSPLFRARRIGRDGGTFTCFKLRTMRSSEPGRGPALTTGLDPRITRVGRLLRRYRLDELPQLWNVARGEMLLVGPRPEDPRFVDFSDPVHRRVFRATPGITGLTQLAYSKEATLLDLVDPERHYRHEILPAKLELDRRYLDRRSLRLDLWILGQTVFAAFGHPPTMAEIDRHC